MDIKNITGFNQYGQNRISRGDTGDASSVARGSGTAESGQTSGADRVTLSDGAKLVSVAVREAQGSSDVRADKVAELKAQVQSGTYQPDSRKIAEKMLTMDSDLFS